MTKLKGVIFYNAEGVVIPAIENPEIKKGVLGEIFMFQQRDFVGKGKYTEEEILQLYGLFLRGGSRTILKGDFQGGISSSNSRRIWNIVQGSSQNYEKINEKFVDELSTFTFEEAKTLISLSAKNHDQTVPLSELDYSQEIGERLYGEVYNPKVVVESISQSEKIVALRKTHPKDFSENSESTVRILRQPYGWGYVDEYRTQSFNYYRMDPDGLKVYGESRYTMETDSIMLEEEFLEVVKELYKKGEVSDSTLRLYGLDFSN